MALPCSWRQIESLNVKILLLIIISRVEKKKSFRKVWGIAS